MTGIKYTIEPDDIEWEMDWSHLNEDGSRRYPDKPEKEIVFEPTHALAILLMNEVIRINNHWWEKEWSEKARETVFLGVNCNDVFAWGCSDSEELTYKEIKSLYYAWKKSPNWGPTIWCMIKRREMPQRPVEASMRKAGIDVDTLKAEHSLRPNQYDGLSKVLAKHKYDVYCTWERNRGQEPRPFDAGWWTDWNEYKSANPDWDNEQWKAEDEAIVEKWRKENGHD